MTSWWVAIIDERKLIALLRGGDSKQAAMESCVGNYGCPGTVVFEGSKDSKEALIKAQDIASTYTLLSRGIA